MSFDQSFLDVLRQRLSLVEIVGRRVTWDRQSKPGKGDYWACCPFHHEKSPSFHVLEKEGYYKCFGCGEKGSVFDFVMKTENLSFPEAVERLAGEAGMAMPAKDPRAAEKARRAASLFEVTALAAKTFQQTLWGSEGRAARGYLEGRGMAAETAERFGLGVAPPGRRAVTDRLIAEGVTPEQLLAADLAVRDDDGGLRDRFIGRLMFPIEDGRGRVIAFGGRDLGGRAKAKYLNSRETELFKKGETLYNFAAARAAAGRGAPLIVAEGYMDVIALAAAGFEGATAPLGTALTAGQLQLLWRAAPEPVMALDGDAAGLTAAHRAADLALKHLSGRNSLMFALLPENQDPDDLIKAGGPEAFQTVLGEALSLLELLWRRESAQPYDTPERRAGLEARLEALAGAIPDERVRKHYRRALGDRCYHAFRSQDRPAGPARGQGFAGRGARGGGRRGPGRGVFAPSPGPTEAVRRRAQELAAARQAGAVFERREKMLLAAMLAHPWLCEERRDDLETVAFSSAELDSLRGALLSASLINSGSTAVGATDPRQTTLGGHDGRDHDGAADGSEDAAASRDLAELLEEPQRGRAGLVMAAAEPFLPSRLQKRAARHDVRSAFHELLTIQASNMARRGEIQELTEEVADSGACAELERADMDPHSARVDEATRSLGAPSAAEESGSGYVSATLTARLRELGTRPAGAGRRRR